MNSFTSKDNVSVFNNNQIKKSINNYSSFYDNFSTININQMKSTRDSRNKFNSSNLNFPGHKLMNSQFNQFRANKKMTRYNHVKVNSFRSIDLGSTSTEFNSTRNPFKFVRKVDVDINNLLNSPNRNIQNLKMLSSTAKINDNKSVFTECNIENQKEANLKSYRSYINLLNNQPDILITKIKNKIRGKDNSKVNDFLDNILNNISRKITYYNSRNVIIDDDYVMNLLYEEERNLTKKMEEIFKGKCSIKNFTKYIVDENGNKIFLPLINSYTKKVKHSRNSIFSTLQNNPYFSKTFSNNPKFRNLLLNYENDDNHHGKISENSLNDLLKDNLYGKKGIKKKIRKGTKRISEENSFFDSKSESEIIDSKGNVIKPKKKYNKNKEKYSSEYESYEEDEKDIKQNNEKQINKDILRKKNLSENKNYNKNNNNYDNKKNNIIKNKYKIKSQSHETKDKNNEERKKKDAENIDINNIIESNEKQLNEEIIIQNKALANLDTEIKHHFKQFLEDSDSESEESDESEMSNQNENINNKKNIINNINITNNHIIKDDVNKNNDLKTKKGKKKNKKKIKEKNKSNENIAEENNINNKKSYNINNNEINNSIENNDNNEENDIKKNNSKKSKNQKIKYIKKNNKQNNKNNENIDENDEEDDENDIVSESESSSEDSKVIEKEFENEIEEYLNQNNITDPEERKKKKEEILKKLKKKRKKQKQKIKQQKKLAKKKMIKAQKKIQNIKIKKNIVKIIEENKTIKDKIQQQQDEMKEELIREEEQSKPTKNIIEKIKIQEEKQKEKQQIQKKQEKIVSSLLSMAQGKLNEKMTKSDLNTLLFDQEFGNQVEKLRTEMQNEEDTKFFPEKSKRKISLGEVLEFLYQHIIEFFKKKKEELQKTMKKIQSQQLKSNQMNSLLNSNKKVVTQKNFTSFGNTKDYSSDSSSSESYKLPVLKKPKTVLDNKLKLDIFNKEAWSKRTFQENELLLHNELKYQIMLTNNIESKERLKKILTLIKMNCLI